MTAQLRHLLRHLPAHAAPDVTLGSPAWDLDAVEFFLKALAPKTLSSSSAKLVAVEAARSVWRLLVTLLPPTENAFLSRVSDCQVSLTHVEALDAPPPTPSALWANVGPSETKPNVAPDHQR